MAKLSFFIVILTFHLYHGTSANICCTPDQWDAFLYFDYGNVFIDEKVSGPDTAYSVINGTIKLSYDYKNQRLYMFINGTEYSPLIPKPVPDNGLYLYDYKQGIEYQVSHGTCDKTKLGPNMTRECIPDNAELVMKGTVGNGDLKTASYAFPHPRPLELQVSATVLTDSCIPLHAVYRSNPEPLGGGTLIVLEPLDVSPGIRDPSVFDVPAPCRNIELSQERIKSMTPIRRILSTFLGH